MIGNKKAGRLKSLFLMLLSGIFLATGTISSMAETTLSSIRVSASLSNWEEGMVRIPEFSAPWGCDMDVEWTSPESSFLPGKTVGAVITLTAQEGYRFKSSLSLSAGQAEITSKSVNSSEIVMRVKVGPLTYQLASPQHVSWKTGNSSIIIWSAVKYATAYRVKVYQDNRVVKQEVVRSRTYDAGKYFNGDADVRVSVAAIDDSSSSKQYIRESGEAFVDGSDLSWEDKETTYGVWQGNRYRISDDGETEEYAKGWVEIFGRWYYFNQSGTLQNGWIQDSNQWYYSGEDGIMRTGWIRPQSAGPWYYLNPSGVMQTGWVKAEPNSWYFMRPDGSMMVGWLKDNGKSYFLGTDGKMLYEWNQINGQWYYFHQDGRMASNEQIGSYYVDASGVWRP